MRLHSVTLSAQVQTDPCGRDHPGGELVYHRSLRGLVPALLGQTAVCATGEARIHDQSCCCLFLSDAERSPESSLLAGECSPVTLLAPSDRIKVSGWKDGQAQLDDGLAEFSVACLELCASESLYMLCPTSARESGAVGFAGTENFVQLFFNLQDAARFRWFG